jgi:hypothetical protein
MERTLLAILHADVQGYSHLINEDEIGTLRILALYLGLIGDLVLGAAAWGQCCWLAR